MKNANLKFNFCFYLFAVLFFLFISACQQNNDAIEITFAFNDSEIENTQPLIEKFNKEHKGKIKVNWKKTSPVSDEFYNELKKDFDSGNNEFDVFGADVVWTAALASENRIEDLSSRFYSEYDAAHFVEPALHSAVFNFKVWGIPWYTDTGIIYMRKDLLEKHYKNYDLSTWEGLKVAATKVKEAAGVKHGYVFQGANYEGGVVNACEFIWNSGGSIVLGDLYLSEDGEGNKFPLDIITVDSKEAASGLEMARQLITEGISPQAVSTYREAETIRDFQNGDAVFARGWPGNYSVFLRKDSKVKPSQIAVCPIPVTKKENSSYSCLGGWNLMINKNSTAAKKEAAWAFIKYMTNTAQQKFRALNGGNLPTIKALFDDEELIKEVPVIALGKKMLPHARVRPRSPYYIQLAPKISEAFNRVLTEEAQPEYAVSILQMELEGIEEALYTKKGN